MFLKDLLLNTGIDTKKIMMVRHSLNHERVAGNFKADELAIAKGKPPRCLEFYQRIQNKFVFAKYDYVLTFISAEGTTAVYYGCYKIDGYLDMTEHRADAIKLLPEDYFVKDGNRDEEIRHEALWDLKRITMAPNGAPVLENMENRLVIDWTGRFWFKKEALRRVKISYIKLEISKYQFASYDKVLLTLEQLCHIVKNRRTHKIWEKRLTSHAGVYLITDKKTGRHYIILDQQAVRITEFGDDGVIMSTPSTEVMKG